MKQSITSILQMRPKWGLRYHGNYVGPGWSAGKYQNSVVSNVPCIDEFDCTAKKHDAVYARRGNLKKADYEFYRANIGKGIKRSLAAAAVGLQGYLRSNNPQSLHSSKSTEMVPYGRRYITPPPSGSRGRQMRRGTSSTRSKSLTRRSASARRSVSAPRSMSLDTLRSSRVSFPSTASGTGGASRTGMGSFVRRGRRVRPNNRMGRMINKGVQYCFEHGTVVSTTTQFQGIGHATMPLTLVFKQVWRTLFKRLLVKAGVKMSSYNDPLNLAAGDKIELYWKTQDDAALTTSTYTYVAGDTLEEIVIWAIDDLRGFNVSTTAPQFQFIYYVPIAFNAYTHAANIALESVMVDFYAKSSLKVQNRTINDVGDDENSVDNVPLYGKTYQGSGSGTSWIRGATTLVNFHASPQTGVITQTAIATGANDLSSLGEPPNPKEFVNVKLVGKIGIDPGHIKTSSLTTKVAMNFNRMFEKYWKYKTETVGNVMSSLGKFKFMCLEKMIDPILDGSAISLAVEHNLKFVSSLREKQTNMMTQVFEKSYS